LYRFTGCVPVLHTTRLRWFTVGYAVTLYTRVWLFTVTFTFLATRLFAVPVPVGYTRLVCWLAFTYTPGYRLLALHACCPRLLVAGLQVRYTRCTLDYGSGRWPFTPTHTHTFGSRYLPLPHSTLPRLFYIRLVALRLRVLRTFPWFSCWFATQRCRGFHPVCAMDSLDALLRFTRFTHTATRAHAFAVLTTTPRYGWVSYTAHLYGCLAAVLHRPRFTFTGCTLCYVCRALHTFGYHARVYTYATRLTTRLRAVSPGSRLPFGLHAGSAVAAIYGCSPTRSLLLHRTVTDYTCGSGSTVHVAVHLHHTVTRGYGYVARCYAVVRLWVSRTGSPAHVTVYGTFSRYPRTVVGCCVCVLRCLPGCPPRTPRCTTLHVFVVPRDCYAVATFRFGSYVYVTACHRLPRLPPSFLHTLPDVTHHVAHFAICGYLLVRTLLGYGPLYLRYTTFDTHGSFGSPHALHGLRCRVCACGCAVHTFQVCCYTTVRLRCLRARFKFGYCRLLPTRLRYRCTALLRLHALLRTCTFVTTRLLPFTVYLGYRLRCTRVPRFDTVLALRTLRYRTFWLPCVRDCLRLRTCSSLHYGYYARTARSVTVAVVLPFTFVLRAW